MATVSNARTGSSAVPATAPVAAPVATAPLATAPLATAPLATAPLATAPLATAPLATAPEAGATDALVDPATRVRILATLAQLEDAFNIRILFAAESGSRAWEHGLARLGL
jgi:hypothetical protein